MKRIIKVITLILIIFPVCVCAEEYDITNYNVNISVKENNVFTISEVITADFFVSKHGIYRKIPFINKVERTDGTKSINKAKITNMEINDEYIKTKENGYYVIKIGSPDKTFIGKKTYQLNYDYNIGNDKLKGNDEFYFNIIGTEWDTSISNVTFTITMPKAFDKNLLGFSSGYNKSTNSENVKYQVYNNVIKGYLVGNLQSGQGLTVRLTLPDGYFTPQETNISLSLILLFLMPIICLFLAGIYWFLKGKDNKVIETVEFYPPEGYNSLEVGYLYKGKVEDNHVVSLLIYLANKGYIKIIEPQKADTISEASMKIVKLKEYDGYNENEKIFLDGLFSKCTKLSPEKTQEILQIVRSNELSFEDEKLEVVTPLDLKDRFCSTILSIKQNTETKINNEKIFEKQSSFYHFKFILLMIISVMTVVIIPTADYGDINDIITTFEITLIYLPIMAVGLIPKITPRFAILWASLVAFQWGLILIFFPFSEAITNDIIYVFSSLVGLACTVGIIGFYKIMPRRTPYGNEMLGKIMGFKNFLETSEKEKLEALVMENPTYFYDILPYTYVLGVSNKWIKKFESIAIKSPDWYSSNKEFNAYNFGSFMTTTMTTTQSAMTSIPESHSSFSSDSSSGGFSGGGSSGGGSGGGGGGSW